MLRLSTVRATVIATGIATTIAISASANPAPHVGAKAAVTAGIVSSKNVVQKSKPCKGSVKKGLKAYNRGEYSLALCHWLPKAREGDVAAQNNMGILFENGLTPDTPQNFDEAQEWYALAANRDFLPAIDNLARMQTNFGFLDTAAQWNEKASDLRLMQAEQLAAQQKQQAETDAATAYLVLCLTIGCAPANPAQSAQQPPPAPPKCRVSPWKKDSAGNPAIICE